MAFHHTTAQLLFLSMRTRHGIHPTTAFLMTQVKSPHEEDWGNFKQVLGYLKDTINMLLILLVDSLMLS
jgi:hypothetical protein